MNRSDVQGSYTLGSFQDNEAELIRLQKQASIALKMEQFFWTHLVDRTDINVLDIGCGPGIITNAFANYCEEGTVVGLDYNNVMVEMCNSNAEYMQKKNLSFVQGDIKNIEIDISKFDLLYCRFLFQHIREAQSVFDDLICKQKTGSKICVIDIDDRWLALLPEPRFFRKFVMRAEKAQYEKGGDRFIGSKIAGYLETAGYHDVTTELHMLDTNMVHISDLLDMIINYKYQLVDGAFEAEIVQEREEILNIMEHKYVWGGVGIFATYGTK